MSAQRFAALGASGRAGLKLRAGLLPIPAAGAQSFQSRGPVYGSPGTTRIPAPAPLPWTDSSLAAYANAGNIGEPSMKFAWWTPGLYWVRIPENGSRSPVSVFSDNQMPVPAVDPRGRPGVVMPGPIMLGQTQVANPRVAPKYHDIKKRRKSR